jgi:phage shock protein PspC (stress-responsive transcriptional regulator)
MADQKQLYRSKDGRVLGGVSVGLSKYLGVDRVLVRLVFLALAFVNGLGAMLYMIMWIIVPDESERGLSGEDSVRANLNDMAQQIRRLGKSVNAPQGATVGGLILIGLGIMFLLHQFVPAVNVGMLWPVIFILIGGYLLFVRK